MTFDPSNPDHERFAASPILAAMQKIVPGYWPDDSQGYAMLASKDPEKDAGYIAVRLELVRDAVAHEFGHLGLTRDSITDAQALRALRHFEGLPGTHGNEKNLVKWLGPETLVQIGIDHAVREFGKHNGEIAAYAENWPIVFDRIADPAGLGFWMATGYSVGEVEEFLREAKAMGEE